MNEIILLVIEAVVAAVSVIIMRYLAPLLKVKYEEKVDERTRKMIREAVEAAEQTIKGSGKGLEKKDAVVKAVIEWINKHGINLSEMEIDILIEAAVRAMKSPESA